MASGVNLDALIPREDFQVLAQGAAPIQRTFLQITDLERTAFFFGALRKPDFQRQTEEWAQAKVAGLIKAFIDNDLIPAVILWQNRELLFVIDGSHRLSALIAWVHDDYGDGLRSQEFFGHSIPEEQIKIAQRTRIMVEKMFGSYKSHKEANEKPDAYGPDVVKRARRFASLTLQLQWVSGDATKAEESFFRINQQAANITPQELELLKSRRKPTAIAARAIIRRGTGHKYWSAFEQTVQESIETHATDLHKLMFEPTLRYPIKTIDLPAGGGVYAATALRMVYDLILLCVGVPSPEDDETGQRTIEYLNRSKRVMRLLLSSDASSLGLHPAIFFYSWTGKQQPILFMTMASLVVDWDRAKRLDDFVIAREEFEAFLIDNRSLTNQVIRKFGTKDSGMKHLRAFYERVLTEIVNGRTADEIPDKLRGESAYSYLQSMEKPYDGVAPTRYSAQVKSGIMIRKLLETAPRCGICNGIVPSQAISIDHRIAREEGGPATVSNAQVTHPYCNSGYKERLRSKQKDDLVNL